jgi:hypothetical protein
MRFKPYIALVCLSLFGALSAFSQNGGKIQLSGSVTSVTREITLVDNKQVPYFKVEVYLQFRNLTDRPLIIFKPGVFWGQKTIFFVDSLKTEVEGTSVFDRIWKESGQLQKYDPWKLNYKYMTTPEPDENYFARIEPGSYYETHVDFLLENGFKAEQRIGRTPTDVYFVTIPEYREIKLRYFLSTKTFPSHLVDFAALQNKWKKFGELVLDSDGDYSIESDIFLNKPAD